MVRSRGVEVALVGYEDGRRFSEHGDMRYGKQMQTTLTETYIEVVDIERYEIVIILGPEFDFNDSPDVKIRWEIDGQVRKKIRSAKEIQDAIRTYGQFEYRISETTVFENGAWKVCALSFGGMQIDEEAEQTSDEVLKPVNNIGHIGIAVCCGHRGARIPFAGQPAVKAVAAFPRDIVEKDHVSHSSRYTALRACEPKRDLETFTRVRTTDYRPVEFGLHLCSRGSLQLLKIIPSTPANLPVDTAALTMDKKAKHVPGIRREVTELEQRKLNLLKELAQLDSNGE